jgi:RNA 3'-phosphate cyclase
LEFVEIDGSMLEGGGQILRVSAALSALTGRAARIFNIRAKRNPPGLRLQHIAALKSVASVAEAEVEGLNLGSSEVRFNPKTLRGGEFLFQIGSAGSTMLILQALAPVAAYAPKTMFAEIHGGTNNKWAPPVEYVQQVLFPTLEKIGFRGSVALVRRGFYPRGGGVVRARLNPARRLTAVDFTDFSKVSQIRGLAYVCRLPGHIASRMAKTALEMLRDAGYADVDIQVEVLQDGDGACAVSPGCGLFLVAELQNGLKIAADSLGERGKPSEKVGAEAAEALLSQLGTKAPVDTHLADQLIVWLSLAQGVSRLKVCKLTLHALTSMEVCKLFVGAGFKVEGKLGETANITCEGVGWKNRFLEP